MPAKSSVCQLLEDVPAVSAGQRSVGVIVDVHVHVEVVDQAAQRMTDFAQDEEDEPHVVLQSSVTGSHFSPFLLV
jgi:hypothetical protein